jgi:hypothetical protein
MAKLRVLFVVLALAVGACAPEDSTGSGPGASQPAANDIETPVEDTTPPWKTLKFAGRGDDVLKVSVPNDDAALVYFKHRGNSNFIVVAHDPQGERLDSLVNDIGNYEGIRPVNFTADEVLASLEIDADGRWVIEVRHITTARQMADGTVKGIGDEVVGVESELLTGETARLKHTGESNFIVTAWGESREGIVNEIGKYDGRNLVPAGTLLFEIQADGNWSLTFE